MLKCWFFFLFSFSLLVANITNMNNNYTLRQIQWNVADCIVYTNQKKRNKYKMKHTQTSVLLHVLHLCWFIFPLSGQTKRCSIAWQSAFFVCYFPFVFTLPLSYNKLTLSSSLPISRSVWFSSLYFLFREKGHSKIYT